MRYLRFAPMLLVLGLVSGCAATAPAVPSTLHGDAAHPAQAQGWVETKLYFGLGLAGDASSGVGEQGWRAFLDAEVTPRFPDGLSVVDVYGQWQGKGQAAPERLPVRRQAQPRLAGWRLCRVACAKIFPPISGR